MSPFDGLGFLNEEKASRPAVIFPLLPDLGSTLANHHLSPLPCLACYAGLYPFLKYKLITFFPQVASCKEFGQSEEKSNQFTVENNLKEFATVWGESS